jgi:hypothetical protein
MLLLMLQVPKPLDPQELDQLKQQIASELHAQLAASSGGKELTPEQLAQVGGSCRCAALQSSACNRPLVLLVNNGGGLQRASNQPALPHTALYIRQVNACLTYRTTAIS